VPWSKAQFAFAHDEKRTSTPPNSIPKLISWAQENPGRFTYPAPPDFNGSVFVRHVFYHAAGGAQNLLGDFDQALFDKVADKAWTILNDLEPSLWRAGKTYPQSIQQLDQLFANSEVDITFNYDPSIVHKRNTRRLYPTFGVPYRLLTFHGSMLNTLKNLAIWNVTQMSSLKQSLRQPHYLNCNPLGLQRLKRAGKKT